MANPNRLWGRTRINIDGRQIDCEGKSTIDPGGIKREAAQGDFRTGLHTEMDADSKIECSVLITPDISLTDLNFPDATVTFACDTGQTYVINHAYCMEPPQASDGKAKLTICGPEAEEIR